MKGLNNPPKDVMTVLSAVATLLGRPGLSWGEIKGQFLSNVDAFLTCLVEYDKDNVPDKMIKQIEAYTR